MRKLLCLMMVVGLLAGCISNKSAADHQTSSGPTGAGPAVDAATVDAVVRVVRTTMRTVHLRAVIIRVTIDGRNLVTRAFGTSMDGVPATTDMHFRNGAVAFSYLGTLLMEFVDEHKVTLDDLVGRWMPSLPLAGKVTLKMLANQTSGYPDYETDPAWLAAFNANPFRIWTFKERLSYAFSRRQQFAPGTNWSYSHTSFMILGEILSKIGKKPLDTLLEQKVLAPMGLTHTVESQLSGIPSPVLHSYSSERRAGLGIPPKQVFTEESTFWNSQWGTPIGANETSTIGDLAQTAVQVGAGALLSRASYQAMTDPNLLGFGHSEPVCEPSCFKQIRVYNYGLGIVRSGSWLLQNPELGGYSATDAYLPPQKIAVAVAVTYLPAAFDAQGNYPNPNSSDLLFTEIGRVVAPTDPPPTH